LKAARFRRRNSDVEFFGVVIICLIWIESPDRMRAVKAREASTMGGGAYLWLTPQGMIAAGVAHNPEYGKMAADNIAKEVAERNLTPGNAQDIATGAEQTAAATDEITRTDLSRP
jgi:hypothetical protein